MNRWFVVHDLLAYEQHPDMISNIVKQTGIAKPRFKKFKKIQQGDLIVYYATKDMVVAGIFRVVSDIQYIQDDPYWGEVMVFKIVPHKLPPEGKYLDFKTLVTAPDIHFDMFPVKAHWGNYLQGKTCVLLSDRDYSTIESSFSQKKYLKNRDEIRISATRWHDKYGKELEKLLLSLSATEKKLLRAIMSYEKKSVRVIKVEELNCLPAFQNINSLQSLKEFNRKRLVKFMKWKKNKQRISLTRRGRTIARLLR